MNMFKKPASRLVDWSVAGVLAVIAAVVYFVSMADYMMPGSSARLLSIWQGLTKTDLVVHPLGSAVAGSLGNVNLMGPIFGAISVICLYMLVSFFIYERINDADGERHAAITARIGGVVAAVVFMFTPAVHSAATHLEPRLFDIALALCAFALFIPAGRAASKGVSLALTALAGVIVGVGLVDAPVFLPLVFFGVAVAWMTSLRREEKPYYAATTFLAIALIAFTVGAAFCEGGFQALVRSHSKIVVGWFGRGRWGVGPVASLLFVVSLLASRFSFNQRSNLSLLLFHLLMTFLAIIECASPLSPSEVMRPFGELPVASCALVSVLIGYIAAYWWFVPHAQYKDVEGREGDLIPKIVPSLAYVVGGLLVMVVVFTLGFEISAFDGRSGAFADRVADRVIKEMGDRTWLVTDGTLDDHLRQAAVRAQKHIELVNLRRDDDKYREELESRIASGAIGGDVNTNELAAALSVDVWRFLTRWLEIDSAVSDKLASFGYPDLWVGAQMTPVPGFFLCGGVDFKPNWSEFEAVDSLLDVPDNWGSHQDIDRATEDPVLALKRNLRRHLGMMANNRGVWLLDENKAGAAAEAFGFFDLALSKIDCDNVCALFNAFELSAKGEEAAKKHLKEYRTRIESIVKDPDRRYRLLPLGNYYGYVRNVEVFVRLGATWAKSGRPGEALSYLRRAVDFVPNERRAAVMNMMAALMANDSDSVKSREMYESVLSSDAENHDALIGLMRLELIDGDKEKAIGYLKRAVDAAGDDPRALVEIAMLSLMENRLDDAKTALRKATDADRGNLQAWSLLAAVTIQQIDAEKDQAKVKVYERELKDEILRTMEKQARSPSDYYLQTTRAFVLMRQGNDKRREARDALIAASRDRPDVGATSDLILQLDISLDDTEDAERQARQVLSRNYKAPLANYVMGSLALKNGDLAKAETFLRQSVAGKKPVVLALNDLAEVLRRTRRYDEAESVARKAIAEEPQLYVAWETLGAILMDANKDLDEAEKCVRKACDLSKDANGREADVRMLISLARIQIKKGDTVRGKVTFRKVQSRIDELSDYERKEFEEFRKSVR